MKNISFVLLAGFILLFNFIAINNAHAITRDEMMSMAESYKNYVWTPTEDNACHKITKTVLEEVCCAKRNKERECIKWRDCRIDTPDRNNYTTWEDGRGWEWEKTGEKKV